MDRADFQFLEKSDEGVPREKLPDDWAASVLRRGKQFRARVKRHWKWLRWASLISLLIAIILGAMLPLLSTEATVPPLNLFQPHSESSPFSTK